MVWLASLSWLALSKNAKYAQVKAILRNLRYEHYVTNYLKCGNHPIPLFYPGTTAPPTSVTVSRNWTG
jgi:hypothetical protein